MVYAYSIFGCPKEGGAILRIYQIEKSFVMATRQIGCSLELQNQIFNSSDKDRRKLLRKLYCNR